MTLRPGAYAPKDVQVKVRQKKGETMSSASRRSVAARQTRAPGFGLSPRAGAGSRAQATPLPVLPALHPSPRAGALNDRYEREADRVADEVLRTPDPLRSRVPPLLVQQYAPQAPYVARQATSQCTDAATGATGTASLLARTESDARGYLAQALRDITAVLDQEWWLGAVPELQQRIDYYFGCPDRSDLEVIAYRLRELISTPLPGMVCMAMCSPDEIPRVPQFARPPGTLLGVCPQLIAKNDSRGIAGRLLQVAGGNIGLRVDRTARAEIAAGEPASRLVRNSNAYARFAVQTPPSAPSCATSLPQRRSVVPVHRPQPRPTGPHLPGPFPSQDVWVSRDSRGVLSWSWASRPRAAPVGSWYDPLSQSHYFMHAGRRYNMLPGGRVERAGGPPDDRP